MIRPLVILFLLLTGAPLAAASLVPSDPKPVAFVLHDRDGVLHNSAEFARTPLTLLHFWASWCLPCREELPALAKLRSDLGGQGVRVVAVSLDRLGWDAIDRATRSLAVVNLELYHDLNREAATALAIKGLPTTLILDAEGREIARMEGQGDWGNASLRRQLLDFASRRREPM
ncbi:MAG: TlpA family protein disulfide reductase [Alphaproteobacteria bacterium]|nr:TlpA family protein disulfide reductase [Alphaproteobacteria bacterium]